MDVRAEIAKQVEKLPSTMQEQVLRYVTSLAATAPRGEPGSSLRKFANTLDAVSAREMTEAIEQECERVDAGQW